MCTSNDCKVKFAYLYNPVLSENVALNMMRNKRRSNVQQLSLCTTLISASTWVRGMKAGVRIIQCALGSVQSIVARKDVGTWLPCFRSFRQPDRTTQGQMTPHLLKLARVLCAIVCRCLLASATRTRWNFLHGLQERILIKSMYFRLICR